ncbi:MAG: hypothetical protein B7Z66_06300 [Chromatiales bacterium 21-64-14]|nr:MAG: hypothetical protein B7Z66_06300 [Chromatiales bacterium 21-64-14]HQU15876.1 YbaK/EbsC family protein [Gammaproteobacteria bacterium]
MSISSTVEQYLIRHGVDYDLVAHSHTGSSMETAAAAHIPGDRIAKGVILEDDGGYLMVVLPATRHVRIGALRTLLRRNVILAEEPEIAALFRDCAPGAVPALGPAYGMETVIDDILAQQPELYFEAGDHEELVHVPTERFFELLGTERHGEISQHT